MKKTMTTTWCKAQRGFSIVTAIFLLVVLAGLGAAMVTFSTSQHQSSALDVLGARAYQASRAGVEWAAFQIVQSSVAVPAGAGGFAGQCQAGAPTASVALAGTLAAFSPVSVACTANSAFEGTRRVWVYRITSSASNAAAATPGATGYVERVMNVSIAQ